MKINIFYQFKESSWGGGNQFLKALRSEFERRGIYTESIADADVILFNSHHKLRQVLKLRRKYTNKLFVHRINGPLSVVRGGGLKNKCIDRLIIYFSNQIADATIIQSKWSLLANEKLGYHRKVCDCVIYNAPDNSIFNLEEKVPFSKERKIRLISTSWSKNKRKGFDAYKYLDGHLDFQKYDFIFIGNSPIDFTNIKSVPPLSSHDLAKELKKGDIFITASKSDPCSNSLIEAISCGLPAVVMNDGGHPELVGKGGELFNAPEEIEKKLKLIEFNYTKYQSSLSDFSIKKTAEEYLAVFEKSLINKQFKTDSFLAYSYTRLRCILLGV